MWEIFPRHEIINYLEEPTQMGNTPLHLCVRACNFVAAEFLIKTCKVKVNVRNKMENSPLHVAILNNQVQIAEMLVEAKIDVLMLNKEQSTCHDLA